MIASLFRTLLRSNPRYYQVERKFDKSALLNKTDLRDYQNTHLKRLIHVAYENVPYYRRVMTKAGVRPDDIRTVDDLKRLPFMDKGIVRQEFKNLINIKSKGLRFKAQTGGTSGNPCSFLRDLGSIWAEKAIVTRQYRWVNRPARARRILLRGDLIVPVEKRTPPFWKYDFITNQLIVSTYHLSDENMLAMLEEIIKFKPWDMHAYPSAAALLAAFCIRKKVNIKLNAVFTSSEALVEHQRRDIEQAFSCRVYDWYGSAERVAAICECENGNYHEMSDAAIVEYLPVGEGLYEVVGTTLFNDVMPLIRYKIGDLVELAGVEKVCACGRAFPLIEKIHGRAGGFLITPDGRRIASAALTHLIWGVEGIVQLQFIQKKTDFIEVLMVVGQGDEQQIKEDLVERLKKFISHDIDFVVKIVKEIPKTSSNKYQWIIQDCSNLPEALAQ